MTVDDAIAIRERTGLSQGNFAKKLKMHRNSINGIETGRSPFTGTMQLLYEYIDRFGLYFDSEISDNIEVFNNKLSDNIKDYKLVKSSDSWSCRECYFFRINCQVPNKYWLDLCNKKGWIFKKRLDNDNNND